MNRMLYVVMIIGITMALGIPGAGATTMSATVGNPSFHTGPVWSDPYIVTDDTLITVTVSGGTIGWLNASVSLPGEAPIGIVLATSGTTAVMSLSPAVLSPRLALDGDYFITIFGQDPAGDWITQTTQTGGIAWFTQLNFFVTKITPPVLMTGSTIGSPKYVDSLTGETFVSGRTPISIVTTQPKALGWLNVTIENLDTGRLWGRVVNGGLLYLTPDVFPDGHYQFTFFGQDVFGNWIENPDPNAAWFTQLVLDLTLDNTGPKVMITHPQDGSTIASAGIPVNGNAFDAGSGLASVEAVMSPTDLNIEANGEDFGGLLIQPKEELSIRVTAVDFLGNSNYEDVSLVKVHDMGKRSN